MAGGIVNSAAPQRAPAHEANRKAALDASWERRRLAVATKIEKCALTLFLARGLEAVSVEEIAQAAEISRRTFYRYFEAPTDVVRTVLCRSMDRWAQAVRERPNSEPILDSFRSADAYALSSPDNGDLVRLAMAVMRRSPEAWRRISGPIQAHTARTYRDIVAERLRATGQDPRAAGAIAAALSAIMMHLAEASAREGRDQDATEFERAILAFQEMLSGRRSAAGAPGRG
jgi:AcrR family transcriptional regulator